ARITLLSDIKWGAKIIAPNSDSAWENRGDYVDIEGFDITGDGRLGILNLGSFVRSMRNHDHKIPAPRTSSGGAGLNNLDCSVGVDGLIGALARDHALPLSVK